MSIVVLMPVKCAVCDFTVDELVDLIDGVVVCLSVVTSSDP